MIVKAAKLAAASFVTGILSLSFAMAAHGAVVSTDTKSQTGGTSTSTEPVSMTSDTVSVATATTHDQKTVTVVSSGDDSTGVSKTTSSSDQSHVPPMTGGPTKPTASGLDKRVDSNTATGLSSNEPQNVGANKDSGIPVVTSDSPTPPTPQPVSSEVAMQIQTKMAIAVRSTFNPPSQGLMSESIPATPPISTPAPKVPAPKSLPIQGALQGFSSVLATTVLPIRIQAISFAAATQASAPIRVIILVSILLLAATAVVARFVDQLRASGYAHAARADALNLFSFATPQKVSFVWAYAPSQKLTFFGVRNKPILNLY